jgi:hypothetical protein
MLSSLFGLVKIVAACSWAFALLVPKKKKRKKKKKKRKKEKRKLQLAFEHPSGTASSRLQLFRGQSFWPEAVFMVIFQSFYFEKQSKLIYLDYVFF